MWRRQWLWLVLIFRVTSVHADVDGERTALAQLVHELDALLPLVAKAQAQAEQTTRVQFQYDWLLLDIERIKLGIQEHLTAPKQARRVPPLQGDYRR